MPLNFPATNLIKKNIEWGEKTLLEHDITNAKQEIKWFLKKKFNINHQNNPKEPQLFSKNDLNFFIDFLKRRLNKEPFQYILETAPFYNEDFFVDKHVLIPRAETEIIIDVLLKKRPYNEAVDIGTGSGNLAIILRLKNIAKKVLATDVSSEALNVAKINATKLLASNIKFKKHDFLTNPMNKKFDLIVSNPPYITNRHYKRLDRSIKYFEPQTALTDNADGYTFYRKFASSLHKILQPKGTLILEIGLESTKKTIDILFKNQGWKTAWHKDYNNNYRIVEINNE